METPQDQPDPVKERSDVDKIKRLVALKHIAHEGIMLDKIQKEMKLVQDLAVQVRDGTLGTAGQTEAFPEEEGEMGVSIGNETHNHITLSEPKQPEPTVKEIAVEKSMGFFKRWALPIIIGMAIPVVSAGGLGTMAGAAYGLYQFFKQDTTVTTVVGPENIFGIEVRDTPGKE